MSANLDLVRSIYADWERGDFWKGEWADPQIEWVRPEGPEPGTGIGVAAITQGFRDWLSAWEGWNAEAVEYRELDGERVLVITTTSGRGRSSGLQANQLYWHGANLFHIRDGKVTRFVTYWYLDRALADLGLAPEGDEA